MGISIYSKLPKRGYAVGTFLGESVISNDTILRSYRMDQPLTTYITHMAVSEYTQVDYTHNALNGPLPFQLVARAPDTIAMRNTFVGLGDAVDALESWWGPYWWERVGYIITPQGAMEHPTSIAYPRSVGVSGNSVGHQDLMSHELWGGNLINDFEKKDIEENKIYGMNAGLFGFKNNMIDIFKKIENFMSKNMDKGNVCLEQPFLNVYLYRNNLYDVSFSDEVTAKGYHMNTFEGTAIHFTTDSGNYVKKIEKMIDFKKQNNL
jgi:hypothetical protein